MKSQGFQRPIEGFRPIHMPANTGAGVILAAISTAMGFGLIWQMWWLVILGFAGIIAVAIGQSFQEDHGHRIAADEVVRTEGAHIDLGRKAA